MIPDLGIAEAIRKMPEANLQERLRAETRRLRSGERALALESFHSSLYTQLSITITEALSQGNIGAALPMLIDSTPLLRASGRAHEGALWLDQILQQPEAREQPRVLLLRGNLALGQLRIALGDFDGALLPLRKALSSSETLQDKHATIIVSNQLALTCDRLGRYTEAQALYHNALRGGSALVNEADLCMLQVSLSASYLLSGDYVKALTAAQEALSYPGGSKENLAFGRLNYATALIALHHPDAPEAIRETLPAATHAQEPALLLFAQLYQSFLETDVALAQKNASTTLLALQALNAPIPPLLLQLLQNRGLRTT